MEHSFGCTPSIYLNLSIKTRDFCPQKALRKPVWVLRAEKALQTIESFFATYFILPLSVFLAYYSTEFFSLFHPRIHYNRNERKMQQQNEKKF